ncbi:phosphate acyltransferase PlsX [Patescibacteria group bacterium]|nr:phosphate acyltransferase PlsX [Patescibacteria group bacterium]
MQDEIIISVDAMGGDHYPAVPVHGAVLALQNQDIPDHVFFELIGREQCIREALASQGRKWLNHPRLLVVNATQVIETDESLNSARSKRNSSMHVGITRQTQGLSQAFVSAGNTGVLMALSTIKLKLVPGITRPAMTAIIPTENGDCVQMDLGGSVDNIAEQLAQWAVMGSLYSKFVIGVDNPRIGLMNVGKEDGKGDKLRIEAFRFLMALDEAGIINFARNIEGDDILIGKTDVVVFDGFTANVQLKMIESIIPRLENSLRKTLREGSRVQKLIAALALMLLKPTLKTIKAQFDYQRYNGAPFLGLWGVSVKAHGKSTPLAFMYAIRRAYLMVEQDVTSKIRDNIGGIADILAKVRAQIERER